MFLHFIYLSLQVTDLLQFHCKNWILLYLSLKLLVFLFIRLDQLAHGFHAVHPHFTLLVDFVLDRLKTHFFHLKSEFSVLDGLLNGLNP